MRKLSMFLLLILLIVLLEGVSKATSGNIDVCSGSTCVCTPPTCFNTISSAINSLDNTNNNVVIRVAEGTYTEGAQIDITKSGIITIEGGWKTDFSSQITEVRTCSVVDSSNGNCTFIDRDKTIIDGQGQYRGFYINPLQGHITLTIKDLTVANGLSSYGGGLYAYNTEAYLMSLSLLNSNYISNNAKGEFSDGGAIVIEGRENSKNITAVLRNNKIYDNHSEWDTGGILFFIAASGIEYDFSLENNEINGNSHSYGSAVYVYAEGDINSDILKITLKDNYIHNNEPNRCFRISGTGNPADNGGIGFHFVSTSGLPPLIASVKLINNTISFNRGGVGAGVHTALYRNTDLTFYSESNRIENNLVYDYDYTNNRNNCADQGDSIKKQFTGGGFVVWVPVSDENINEFLPASFTFLNDTIINNDIDDLRFEGTNAARNKVSFTANNSQIGVKDEYDLRSFYLTADGTGNTHFYRGVLTLSGIDSTSGVIQGSIQYTTGSFTLASTLINLLWWHEKDKKLTINGIGDVNEGGVIKSNYTFKLTVLDNGLPPYTLDSVSIKILKPDKTIYYEDPTGVDPMPLESGNYISNIDCQFCIKYKGILMPEFECPYHQPVKIVGGSEYSSLQSAYNDAPGGATIQSHSIRLAENLDANRNVSLIIDGGYNCDYTNKIGVTGLKGKTTLTNGKLSLKNYLIKK